MQMQIELPYHFKTRLNTVKLENHNPNIKCAYVMEK